MSAGGAGAGRTGTAATLAGVVRLSRWPNVLLSVAGVLVGAWWVAGDAFLVAPLAWAAVAAVFATASINTINDVFDVDIDRRAHPDRALVRGEVGLDTAKRVALLFLVVAIVAARIAGRDVRSLVVVALLVGFAYSPWLKRHGLLGNVAVALAGSIPFLAGAAAVGDAMDAIALFAVAAPLHLAREIVKDVADAPGDASHRRTLALVAGERVSRAAALLAVAAHAVLVTFLFAAAGPRRLLLVPAIALAAVAILAMPAPRAATLLKLAMLLGMSAALVLR